MTDKTLFLAWQDKRLTRAWFPVGRLDVRANRATYRFRYTKGAQSARERAGFEALLDFPELDRAYEASELFPLFKNRVISANRSDFGDYLKMLDLPETAEPAEILEVGGGYRATDSFEVFPKIVRRPDGFFCCRFFLHGARHVNEVAMKRIDDLKPGEPLYVTLELTNPSSRFAVQIQTTDYYMIGWAPRYLVNDLVGAIARSPDDYRAEVVRVNPAPAPSKQRLLVELTGRWPDYEPMSDGDFAPLVH
ncbi:MAG: HIRAN domain-containing protein [Bradyrhizobium sp.]|uniref:HIRAN domain-containing protein n=1 Tax=Pseudomonadota TaxID=1224 RepID=UPI003D0C26AA